MSALPNPSRAIPAVEKVLQALGPLELPRPMVTTLVRRELSALRKASEVPSWEELIADLRGSLANLARSRIQPVINGTGILIHTNLGRAPLAPEAVHALTSNASGYTNLEYDLNTGERGARASYLEAALAVLSGAPAATVVNNCAAALMLTLRHFTAKRQQVVISRGELVQIGGGFRIPEILEASGARLHEVGTTNKTALEDYERAIGPETGLILKVHRSNFFMGGFVASPSVAELAALARRKHVPFVEDLGSGAVVPTERLVVGEHEPTPAESIKNGVDLVTFSGDKLLGGPQAGIIVGEDKHVAALKRQPFFRALRCDKLVLSALQATVELYLSGKAEQSLPLLTMLRMSPDELHARAVRIAEALATEPVRATVGAGVGRVGGGTLPQASIPSVTLDLLPAAIPLPQFAAQLRTSSPGVIGYLEGGVFKLDLRTVLLSQDEILLTVLRAGLQPTH